MPPEVLLLCMTVLATHDFVTPEWTLILTMEQGLSYDINSGRHSSTYIVAEPQCLWIVNFKYKFNSIKIYIFTYLFMLWQGFLEHSDNIVLNYWINIYFYLIFKYIFIFWDLNGIISLLLFCTSKVSTHTLTLVSFKYTASFDLIGVTCAYILTYVNIPCSVCIILLDIYVLKNIVCIEWPIQLLFPGENYFFHSWHCLVACSCCLCMTSFELPATHSSIYWWYQWHHPASAHV